MNLPPPFWKKSSSFSGLKVALGMQTNFQDILDGLSTTLVDLDTNDGQANNAGVYGPAAGVTISGGMAVGGWDDVVSGTGVTNNGAVALIPVGPRNYTMTLAFEVGGTAADSNSLWLYNVSHPEGPSSARVRYTTGTNIFNLLLGFCGDSFNMNVTAGVAYDLEVSVYDDSGVMKAEYSLNGVSIAILSAGVPLSEIDGLIFTFPRTFSVTPAGAGLTFEYLGFFLETTS